VDKLEVVPPARRFIWQDENTAQAYAEMQAAFAEDGYLICDGFASAQECSEMIAEADKLITAFDETKDQVVFSASGQSHAASDYFMDSASQIRCFLEAGAVDEAGCLIKPKMQAVNKIGHALHDLNPVFSRFSRQDKCADIARLLGLNVPLLLQSMVICKQPFIGGEVNSHQDSTFLYTAPESCIGLWFALEPATTANGCMWAARGGQNAPLKSRFHKQEGQMVMTALSDVALADCTTPLEADTGTLIVLHGRLPHFSHKNSSAASRYAYALHLIDGNCSYPDDNWLQRSAELPLRGF
jgi:phytanoyl-CoA hydroxylase